MSPLAVVLNRDKTTGSIDATVAPCLSGATLAPMIEALFLSVMSSRCVAGGRSLRHGRVMQLQTHADDTEIQTNNDWFDVASPDQGAAYLHAAASPCGVTGVK